MEHTGVQPAVSVVRAPNLSLVVVKPHEWWRPRVVARSETIREHIAHDLEEDPSMCEYKRPALDPLAGLRDWLMSLKHGDQDEPPPALYNEPTAAVAQWSDYTEVDREVWARVDPNATQPIPELAGMR